jgi:hypothetical protein
LPVTYGEGVMRLALPRWMTGFGACRRSMAIPVIRGPRMFHALEAGVTIAATVNQIDRPGTVFRLILKAP